MQVARALVDALAAGAASADADYVVCVALATDSPDILQQFQREFGANLIHVAGPVVHIDRRWEWPLLIAVLQLMNRCFVPHFGCILYHERLIVIVTPARPSAHPNPSLPQPSTNSFPITFSSASPT